VNACRTENEHDHEHERGLGAKEVFGFWLSVVAESEAMPLSPSPTWSQPRHLSHQHPLAHFPQPPRHAIRHRRFRPNAAPQHLPLQRSHPRPRLQRCLSRRRFAIRFYAPAQHRCPRQLHLPLRPQSLRQAQKHPPGSHPSLSRYQNRVRKGRVC